MAETMGSLIDKICIAELKIFHIQEQADRTDLAPDLRELSRKRLSVMKQQQIDLVAELNDLADRWMRGAWRPKIYRQFKMYNDPRFRTTPPRA